MGEALLSTPLVQRLQGPVLLLWLLASLVLALRLLVRTRALTRARGGWSERPVAGRTVWVSTSIGPAVAGVLRPRVVLPAWTFDVGEPDRELILAHEEEHVRARDPLTAFLATLPVVAMPWNAALWWQLSRLRLAVELDCDARVLRRRPDERRRYGALLVEVGLRNAGHDPALAAFSHPRPFLERRIRTMLRDLPENPLRRAAFLIASALAVVAVACLAPEPDEDPLGPADEAGEATATRPAGETAGPVFTPFSVAPEVRNVTEVTRALERKYPPLLRDAGVGGTANVWMFIDAEGTVRDVRLRESAGHEALDQAALRVAGQFEFTPALNGDREVPVWVSLPITFRTRGP